MNGHFAIESINAAQLELHLSQLADLLRANVLDGASVSFVLPFSQADAEVFWTDKIKPSLVQKNRILLVAKQDSDVAGCVMLDCDMPPNQPHRAEIAKLLVHPKYRRRGIARALMAEIENYAHAEKRRLLVLDTANEGAEALYDSLGYLPVGRIPEFAYNVDLQQLQSTTIMYKELK